MHWEDEAKFSLTAAGLIGGIGGIAGGVQGSLRGVSNLGMAIARPAALFSFYTLSSLSFRKMAGLVRQRDDLANAAIGTGWTSLFFAKSLTGRPWIAGLPMAMSTAVLAAGTEWLLRNSLEFDHKDEEKDAVANNSNWLLARWKRSEELEAQLASLNDELYALKK